MHSPDRIPNRHEYVAAGGRLPVAVRVPLPASPRELLRRLAPGRRPFLLESGKGTAPLARYSFFGGDPRLTVRGTANGVAVYEQDACIARHRGAPLTILRDLLAAGHTPRPDGFPPFIGGFIGTFSYDLARRFERLPASATDDLHLPDIDLSFVDLVCAVDHVAEVLWVICSPSPSDLARSGPARCYELAQRRIEAVLERLARPALPEGHAPVFIATPQPGISRQRFRHMVRAAKAYIAQGDIFQANLSQRFSAKADGLDPWHLYETLSRINPSPFAAFLDQGEYAVVSSSPERLVKLSEGIVQARPIAGTRPRGRDAAADRDNGAALLASDKERAEHLMLVDLMRNDLGRVCDYGSVQVSEFMATERYSHVIHIVSNVIGTLGPGKDALSVLRAVFPGGTITGAPKVRCMEIIEELEPVRRGIYTGSAGYLSLSGEMDLNILIRTILVQDGMCHFQTGAGIVADSDPEAEYRETLHKAEAMRRAIAEMAPAAVAGGAP